MPLPLTETMRDRWRFYSHIAQASEAPNSDYRPNARVFVARGSKRAHYFPPYPREIVPSQRRRAKARLRGDWDEKYKYGGQPGEVIRKSPSAAGDPMADDMIGSIEIPNLKNIRISESLDQNGVGTAVVTIGNWYLEGVDSNPEMLYHILREGFFSPFYSGDDLGFQIDEIDSFIRTALASEVEGELVYNEAGKRLSGLLLPNRHIDIYQGYGDELQRTFTGFIDNVEVQMKPPQITLNCTNSGKLLTHSQFLKTPNNPRPYPVAFGDARYWRSKSKKKWLDSGAPRQMILVNDITDIVGHLLGWGGFQYFKSPRPGRIGSAGLEPSTEGKRSHDAIFQGEAFDKGNSFIDGINRVRELLGYHLYITPEFWDQRPMSERFRDPDEYDAEYSRYTIGLPYFVPSNIWQKTPTVEQFSDVDILLNATLSYDAEPIRKNMYVTNSGVNFTTGRRKGRPMTIGASAPWDLDRGITRHIMYDMRENMGSVTMSQEEVLIFIYMTMIQQVVNFSRGSIQVPGYPGAKLNDQCDILERTSGTWRRFFITGFESEMTLGPNGSYSTRLQVVNMDNLYIRGLKEKIRKLGGWKGVIGHQGNIRETARPA